MALTRERFFESTDRRARTAYAVRVDHNFNSNNSMFGRYLFSDYNTLKGDPLNSRPQVFPNEPPLGSVPPDI